MWLWTDQDEDAMQELKDEICLQWVLAHYNVNAQRKINADTSAYRYGLGTVLQQSQAADTWHPIAFASCSLNETEMR